MKIETGDFEVLASGTVFNYPGETITFHLHEEMKITFEFEFDDSDRRRVEGRDVTNNHGVIVFRNFRNVLGEGYDLPVSIGNIGKRPVTLKIWIYSFNGTDAKKVDYTFFLGKEEDGN
jgi:hypothetical protein